jgi:lexA repressor
MVARRDMFAKYKNAIYSGASKISNSLDRLSNVCYSVNVNEVQKKLLDLAETVNLSAHTYYRLAKILDVDHPYKVQFAIDQLVKKGKLVKNYKTGAISRPKDNHVADGIISIPYYGYVNCGEALTFAQDRIEGYLKITPSTVSISDFHNLFALKASGNSMNKADIGGRSVDDGDYVIARKEDNYCPKNGDHVISIIGGAANLKKFRKDTKNRQIILESESTEDLPPIVISEQDINNLSAYSIAAKAVAVVKMT